MARQHFTHPGDDLVFPAGELRRPRLAPFLAGGDRSGSPGALDQVLDLHLAARLLVGKLPRWDKTTGSIDLYAWYYGSYALYQHGGQAWRDWSKALNQALIEPQRKDGNSKGSWDPEPDVWGEDGGRVFTTALGALTLQSYYRYSRVLR